MFAKLNDRVFVQNFVMEVTADLLMIVAGFHIGSFLKNMML